MLEDKILSVLERIATALELQHDAEMQRLRDDVIALQEINNKMVQTMLIQKDEATRIEQRHAEWVKTERAQAERFKAEAELLAQRLRGLDGDNEWKPDV